MIVACVRLMSAGKIKRECRTFETSTASLQALLDWLAASGCAHVAMDIVISEFPRRCCSRFGSRSSCRLNQRLSRSSALAFTCRRCLQWARALLKTNPQE